MTAALLALGLAATFAGLLALLIRASATAGRARSSQRRAARRRNSGRTL